MKYSIILFLFLCLCAPSFTHYEDSFSLTSLWLIYEKLSEDYNAIFERVKNSPAATCRIAVLEEANVLREIADEYALKMEYETAIELLRTAIEILRK